MNFTAIDFETATGYRNSACAVGIVTVENGEIVDQYSALIRPPENHYWGMNIGVHGIYPSDTASAPSFAELYPEIHNRLHERTLVAHNAPFDRSVLQKTMDHYGLDYDALQLNEPRAHAPVFRFHQRPSPRFVQHPRQIVHFLWSSRLIPLSNSQQSILFALCQPSIFPAIL